jgi:hypothetical protein
MKADPVGRKGVKTLIIDNTYSLNQNQNISIICGFYSFNWVKAGIYTSGFPAFSIFLFDKTIL